MWLRSSSYQAIKYVIRTMCTRCYPGNIELSRNSGTIDRISIQEVGNARSVGVNPTTGFIPLVQAGPVFEDEKR